MVHRWTSKMADSIEDFWKTQQIDTSQLPELAESGPRIGQLTKPGLDWLPAAEASIKLMLTNDPERLAKSLEGIPGIKINRTAMGNVPYAEIAGQKYQLNRKGLSDEDVGNF